MGDHVAMYNKTGIQTSSIQLREFAKKLVAQRTIAPFMQGAAVEVLRGKINTTLGAKPPQAYPMRTLPAPNNAGSGGGTLPYNGMSIPRTSTSTTANSTAAAVPDDLPRPHTHAPSMSKGATRKRTFRAQRDLAAVSA